MDFKERLNKINQRLDWLRKSKQHLEQKVSNALDKHPKEKPTPYEEFQQRNNQERLCLEIERLKEEQKKAKKLFSCYDKKLRDKFRQYKKYCKHNSL